MFLVGDVLLTEDILEAPFACDLDMCLGACCVEGTSGAPVTPTETDTFSKFRDQILVILEPEKQRLLMENGGTETDVDGEMVTSCLKNGECVYSVKNENGMLLCGIQQANIQGLQKPVSCHLYPIRESKVGDYIALHYHRWKICGPACDKGKKLGIPLYIFLEEPLIRRFGYEWYLELCEVATQWNNEKKLG